MKFRNCAIALLMTGGLLAAPAMAADSGGYFGLAAGQTMADVDGGDIDAALATFGLGSSTTVDDTDVGFKVFGGYRFNRNFAVEGGYTNYGKFTSSTRITSGGSGTGEGEWKGFSIDVAALGILPLNEHFELFGRAGVSLWSLDFDFTATGPGGQANTSESESGVSPLLGLGATFNINSQFSVRAEFERHFDVGDEDSTGTSDVDLISIGVVFSF